MSEPEFGEPVKELPLARRRTQVAYWSAVAKYAVQNPGQWFPLINTPLSVSRLRNIAYSMQGGRKVHVPGPLQEPGMKSRYVQGQFWFRHDPP